MSEIVVPVDEEGLTEVMARQDGLVTRRQVRNAEGTDDDIARLLRQRRWARVHEGVYVDHTGPLTWNQRAWAAVLVHWPAVLDGGSALRVHGLSTGQKEDDPDESPVEVVVDRSRRVRDPPGVRSRQARHFERIAQLHLSPPRVRVEHAVLTAASRARSEDEAVAIASDAVQQRRTTAARLLAALQELPRLPRRRLLLEVLEDVATGAHSALERRFLINVERRHGLPAGQRQVRVEGKGVVYRDVRYAEHHTLVELDGRVGHERSADRWDDLERDVDALIGGEVTLRVGWRQVLAPCRLAATIAQVLGARGWSGSLEPCGPDCSADRRASQAPGAEDPRPSAA